MAINVTFIGAGNMAEAIIASMPKGVYDIACNDISKQRLAYMKKTYGVKTETGFSKTDIIILAVKPQTVEEVLPALPKDILIISLAAGITSEYIEKALGNARVVRAMPNTPLMVKAGATALCKGKNATGSDLEMAKKIFSHAGIVITADESKMDAVTALSGSGPAYIFYLCELLTKAGIELGLDEETANALSVQTIYGAGIMLKTGSPPELRQKVTSKGGTTEAAIKSLENSDLEAILVGAMSKAAQRAKELNK